MRLLLACLVLFLAPAGGLLITDRDASGFEDEFLQDANKQTARLINAYQLNPERLKHMALAPAILQLRGLSSGADVAARVCGAPDSPFRELFDNLNRRCDRWSLLRRARWFALLSTALTAVVFGLVLTARITVQRYASRELWPGNWAMWFVMRGVMLLLIVQVAVSLSGYGVLLQMLTGKLAMTLGVLSLPFVALLLLERKLVLGFVEPEQLRVFRPKGITVAEDQAPAPTARLEARAGIGVARRRRGQDER